MKPVPRYKIVPDPVKGDFIIQTYINSVLGWSFVASKNSIEEAESWILKGVIK